MSKFTSLFKLTVSVCNVYNSNICGRYLKTHAIFISKGGATVTKYTQITNNSNRSLKFELSWPAHCLTVTPQHGTIEPGYVLLLFLNI